MRHAVLHDGNIHRQELRSMTRRIPFPALPFTVKMAIVSVFSAWGFYVAFHVLYYGALSLFQVTMGMLCCALVYSLKKWGRIACVLYLILFIGAQLYVLYDHLTGSPVSMSLLSIQIVQLILFSSATLLLLHKDTARFYGNPDPGAALTRPDPTGRG
jgi:hypothetical protein